LRPDLKHMISTSNVSLRFGKRVLFEEVTIKFTPGNCYGLIGANGAGKSTFVKILSGEIEPQTGDVNLQPGQRLAVLKQNQFAYDEFPVLETVLMGHEKLYAIMKEKDAIYAKADFSEADGNRAAELEAEFAELEGWNAESDAATMLSELEIHENLHYKLMKDLDGSEKVKVLLAQALFGNPDVLLLDEPTNNLDIKTVRWLINFLADFKNTVIVVSHDRYFLDEVCTHIADIDFGKIQIYPGNYSFWYESSQLALRQRADQNKKMDEKRKELEEFIRRFSANVAKSKQATARQKMLEKLTPEEIKPSNRKYPYIYFKPEREVGDQVLNVKNLGYKNSEGDWLFRNLTFTIERDQKVAFESDSSTGSTALFQILAGELEPTEGELKWGVTTSLGYLPNDNSKYFKDASLNLVDWLRQYSVEKDESYIRGFLGRMLFSGEEALKKSNVLSGGEKVRCMFSKLILEAPNVLILDEPTDHLDLESITVLNTAISDFKGIIIMKSRDYQLNNTVASRVLEIGEGIKMDKLGTYEDFIKAREEKKELV
jgi:ATPase subunit of ABC transporter with duplicated ATPase domains